jgi:hypothetical protein
MKLQDIIYILVLLFLLYKSGTSRHPTKHFVWAGLVCLVISMPLFYFWVFFTAERLVWYAAGFFIFAILIFIIRDRS